MRDLILQTVIMAALALLTGQLAAEPVYSGTYSVTANSNPAAGLAAGTLNDFGTTLTATTNPSLAWT
jgi:hypothetical protein